MKEIELSEEVYNKLEEYRRRLSKELSKEIDYSETLELLLSAGGV